MYNEIVDNYANALEFVPVCYKTQTKCVINKAIDTYPCAIQFVP